MVSDSKDENRNLFQKGEDNKEKIANKNSDTDEEEE